MSGPDAEEVTKSALRSGALARRAALSPEMRAKLSRSVSARANAILRVSRPRRVAGYMPIRDECDPRPILETALELGAEVALPAVVDGNAIVFRRYRFGDPLVVGAFGIEEPGPEAEVFEPDLIITPLVGFDRAGERLGYGRGFYDRAASAVAAARGIRPRLLGIAFSIQEVIPRIPREVHDIVLDWIVTERETLDFTRRTA